MATSPAVSSGRTDWRVTDALQKLLCEARACRTCAAHLPLGCRPVLSAEQGARLLIIGQAPGTRVHASGIPWNDPSGDRLRGWRDHLPEYLPLPHPSWRTKSWVKRNPWFEDEVVPDLRCHVRRMFQ